jgi:prepilin signal peptidase PulO-like enzyme (type II secretory pathway)
MRGESFLGGAPARSFCPECRTTLTTKDLIPVLSWVLSRGRCRYCDTKIPMRYPLFELGCGVFCAATVFLLPHDYAMRMAIVTALPFVVSFLMIWREHHYASFPMFAVSAFIAAVYFGLSFG